jgi:hypothetical protein
VVSPFAYYKLFLSFSYKCLTDIFVLELKLKKNYRLVKKGYELIRAYGSHKLEEFPALDLFDGL